MADPIVPPKTSSSPVVGSAQLIDLPSGEGYRLDVTDPKSRSANEITRRRLTNVILFAGTADCGKTTLLASLYLMFHKQPFAGYCFAGSRTLVGFEKRVHLARIASGRGTPTTERSKFSELLHLRVRKQDRSRPAKDLLLCDLWGEDFRDARDSVDGCRRLSVLRRADAFVLLVDGAKLARLEARQQAKSDPITLLRNCLDCGMLSETADVDVLFTKWDIVQRSDDRSGIEAFAEHIEGEIVRQFAPRVGSIRFTPVAAHSQRPGLPLGYGLNGVFQSWVEREPGAARMRLRVPAEGAGTCAYDQFGAELRVTDALPRLEVAR